MTTTQHETVQQQNTFLENRKARREAQSELPKPTEAEAPQEAPEVEVQQEPEEVSQEENTLLAGEGPEELESQPEAESEQEELYAEYNGTEINLREALEWKEGNLRQSDYTRKTQELADNRKSFEAEKLETQELKAKLVESLAVVEVLASEGKKTPEELADMREYEPDEYIQYTERQSQLETLITENKTAARPQLNQQEENDKLLAANPHWMDNGKTTKAFEADSILFNSYIAEQGYTQQEIANAGAREKQTMLDAARYKAQSKKSVASKKVRKVPTVTKSKVAPAGRVDSAVDKAQKAFNADRSPRNAANLRIARRKAAQAKG